MAVDDAALVVDRALPPGTVHIVKADQREIILIPTPSADPEDPLNWSRARKYVNASLVLLYVFSTGIGGASVYSVLTPISEDTGITLDQLNNGTGFLFLLAGWANIVWQPLALTFGRRPTLLVSLAGCVAISEWTAWMSTYPQWAAGRCLYGALVAPVEVLPEICLPDIFFAHERGAFIAWYMFVLCGSNFVAPLLAGFINDGVGWQWVQHWCALILALNLLLAVFFYEETMYTRAGFEADTVDTAAAAASDAEAAPPVVEKTAGAAPKSRLPSDGSQVVVVPPRVVATGFGSTKPYWQRIKPYSYNGLSFRQVLTMAYRPVLIFFSFPNVTWAGFMYGSSLSWYNVYNATTSSILSAAPYNFSTSIVGLSYVAPLIGTAFAAVVSGQLADWSALKFARRAGGLREPEQRLWGLAIYCLIMPAGLLLWGVGAAHGLHWAVLLVGAILMGYCNVCGGSYAIAYNVDCFHAIAGESIVSMILCRNTMSFAFNYGITPWIDTCGLQNTFIAVAILSCAFGLTFLGMMWKGKHLRTISADRYWHYAATQAIQHE